jgi:hypothetical protein
MFTNVLMKKKRKPLLSLFLNKKKKKGWVNGKALFKITCRSYHLSAIYGDKYFSDNFSSEICRLFIYGGYNSNLGILSDFLSIDVSNNKFEWEQINYSKENKITPGSICTCRNNFNIS